MANELTTSKQFTVNWRDAAKGLIVAVSSAVISSIYTALSVVPFHIDWKQMGIVGLAAGVAYLMKNFFTPAQTVITGTPQPPKQLNDEGDNGLSDPNKPTTGKP